MTVTADVIVIGAGVVGASIALELSRAGRTVVIVDRGRSVGSGTTPASSAIIRFNYSTESGVAVAWESSRIWREWADFAEVPPGEAAAKYVRTGMIMLDAPSAPREQTVDLYERAGVPFEQWTPSDLQRAVPSLTTGRFYPPRTLDDPRFWDEPDGDLGASFVAEGGFIDDPLLATRNLLDACRAHGVTLSFGSEVVAIAQIGQNLVTRTQTGQTLEAPVVVNAAGPWSGAINDLVHADRDFGIELRPLRVEVHQVPAPPGYNNGGFGPVITDVDLGIYVRPAAGDTMLIGGTEPACDELEWLASPDEANPNRTPHLFELQTLRAARRFPDLRIPTRPTGSAGVYDVTEDWTPIYDRTSIPGFYVAIGTSGNQFKNGPMIGPIMRTLIEATEAGHDHDAAPLTLEAIHTRNTIALGTYSRLRKPNPSSTRTVLG